MAWKEDREYLLTVAKNKDSSEFIRTFVYTLISHLRGKLHMKFYKKYHGGWRSYGEPKDKFRALPADCAEDFNKAYEGTAQQHYNMSVIVNLYDQEDFINHYLRAIERRYNFKTSSWETRSWIEDEKINKIAQRVLSGYNEEGACQQAL